MLTAGRVTTRRGGFDKRYGLDDGIGINNKEGDGEQKRREEDHP
jgi:hypothetical protein